MNDDVQRIRRIRELFDAVVDLPVDQRRAELERLAPHDTALHHEVEAIITASFTTAGMIVSPAAAILGSADAASLVGITFGPYTATRLVGMGGMGAVYEAVRTDDQFQQRVAIKVMQRAAGGDLMVARFRRERQILASLNHPNIATLLDGGIAADGQPFLVMEFVEGEPITTWCRSHDTGWRDRIALFQQVCGAVHYAHRNLVIHRDLKPANILVTMEGRVKLLDFGIAKLLGDAPDDGAMPLTRGGARAFTPEYASPEQIRGAPLTTASDVYALGVVLFELLTGRRPHRPQGSALVEIERAVLDTPVPRPSTVVTGTTRNRLRGDLDAVLLTALHPEPGRRYASAESFGQDLQRYLSGEPVQAHRDWSGYRLKKFVQRNVAATVTTTVLLLALVAGAAIAIVQAERARTEAVEAGQVSAFLRRLLVSVQPENGRRDIPMSEVLDSAARRIDVELGSSPDVRADIEGSIGQSYQALGRYDQSAVHLQRALQLRIATTGATSGATALAWTHLGELWLAEGKLDSADDGFRKAYALVTDGAAVPDSARAALLGDLGSAAHAEGRNADAERWHRASLAIQERVLGPRSDVTAMSINDVGVAVGDEGHMAQAESLGRQALAILRANHPEPNARVADVLNALATALDLQGKVAPAESAYVETLALRRRLLGPQHPDYAYTLFNYSMFIFDQHRYREAADFSRQILALRNVTLPESHPAIGAALQTLGRSLDQTGDTAGGEAALKESLALRRKYLGPNTWQVASAEGILGEHYTLLRHYPLAERTLLGAESLFVRTLGARNVRTQVNTRRLVALYAAWHRPADAARYRALLSDSAQ